MIKNHDKGLMFKCRSSVKTCSGKIALKVWVIFLLKVHLEAEGHTAVQPSEFFLDEGSTPSLLIVIRNEDIAEHICEVIDQPVKNDDMTFATVNHELKTLLSAISGTTLARAEEVTRCAVCRN